jgi:hypothetical protein
MALLLVSKAGCAQASVPYYPEMLACDYLMQVLVPQLALTVDAKKITVLHTIRCGAFVFNYANRLQKLGHVVAPGSTLTVAPLPFGFNKNIIGNGTRAQLDSDCSICLAQGPNFIVQACQHAFHEGCLGSWKASTCPLCRVELSAQDRTRLKMQILDGVNAGRIDPSLQVVIDVMQGPNREPPTVKKTAFLD